MEDSNSNGMVMPVAPMGYGYGGYPGGGFGGFGNMFGADGGWLVLLLILAMGGGWGGFGGFGGWGGMMGLNMADGFGAFPWILASNANSQNSTNAAFDSLQLGNQISGLRSDVTSGLSDTTLGIAGVNQNICQSTGQIQNSLCSGFAGTTAAVTGAQNAIAQQLYSNEIASLNRSFAEQTANSQGFSGVQSKLADCCCENRLATQGVHNAILQDGSATRQAIAQGIQSIQDKLCQLELDSTKNELSAAHREIGTLQNQLNIAAFRADNTAQTAAIEASQNAQTQYIVNRVAPYPVPAYPVNNPYGCGYGYGYGNGWGGNFGPNPFGNVGYGNGTF